MRPLTVLPSEAIYELGADEELFSDAQSA